MRPSSELKELPGPGPLPQRQHLPVRRDQVPHAWTITEAAWLPRPRPFSGTHDPQPSHAAATHRPKGAVHSLKAIPPAARAAALGFVTGAIFWHFVGFWSFMSQIVFSSPERQRQTAQALARPPENSASPIETGSLQRLEKLTSSKVENSCTAITRNPATGQTLQSQCRRLSRPLRMKPPSPRQDLAAVASSATETVPSGLNLQEALPLAWPLAVAGQ